MNKKFDRIAGIAFLLVGILFLVESQKISESAYGSSVGPKIFPMWLGILLIALSIRLIYETFKYKSEESKKEQLQYKKFLIIFVSAVLYAFFLEKIGYVVSTFLFLLIAFQTMERGKIIYSVIISAFFSFGVYYFFSELLGGSLPGFPLL
ncbi:tripartite tricarboxylate transporter TctB family protein [Psychrobacillus sp. NPDC096389]|uniref:tripartite tricarboxylate transporter TctB family protein n=1 Tax=Psychrobacillus sp. NPDC096389 TaxID=3364490 RepID=UPI0038236E81